MQPQDAQINLTLEWTGQPRDRSLEFHRLYEQGATDRPEPAPPLELVQPSVISVFQLFYGIRLLYAEAFDLDPSVLDTGHRISSNDYFQWRNDLESWVALLEKLRLHGPRFQQGDQISDWPLQAPAPLIPADVDLRIESLSLASPLQIVLAIPREAFIPVGLIGVWRFIDALEKVWNTKKRIRLEGIELDRKIDEERLARDLTREQYEDFAGFKLREGAVRLPEDLDDRN
jgi:hypothetical protein